MAHLSDRLPASGWALRPRPDHMSSRCALPFGRCDDVKPVRRRCLPRVPRSPLATLIKDGKADEAAPRSPADVDLPLPRAKKTKRPDYGGTQWEACAEM